MTSLVEVVGLLDYSSMNFDHFEMIPDELIEPSLVLAKEYDSKAWFVQVVYSLDH
jgi:hypothetical protein